MVFAYSRLGLRIAAPAVVVALGLVVAFYYRQRRDAEAQSQETLDVYADLINRIVLSDLRQGMVEKDRASVQAQLERFAGMAPIQSLRIVNKNGKVVFATDPSVLGTVMQKSDPSCVTCHQPGLAPQKRARSLRFETPAGGHVYRAVQPILVDEACTSCHDQPVDSAVGVLLTDLDDDALTGRGESNSARTFWAAALAIFALFAVIALLLGRTVVFRLRHLRHMLDLLRTGARATVLSVGKADEIDEVTRAVQALTLDLDGRVAEERAIRRLGAVLERQSGPVLLIDSRGWIVAANRQATDRFAERGATLAGCWAAQIPGVRAEQLALARELGWALPEGDDEGPALMALADGSGERAAFLALWMAPENAHVPSDYTLLGQVQASAAWQLYGTVIAESVVPAPQAGSTVLRFDSRLGRVRRMAADLTVMGREAHDERDDVDLKSLAMILLWDLKREWPRVRWHTLQETNAQTFGVRYQLRELMQRLARAAAAQAGTDGHVVLFAHGTAGTVFLAAWASQPGGQVVLDPADAPALARAVAVAHGGGVEVDPAFDLSQTPGFASLKLPSTAPGTLYVAELALRAVPRPHGRFNA